ncbi:PGAM-domain-containing protein [Lophiostoma macrostomum CBS 122681]|uniref:PGAM-domain-containing protein n=1 Tax=Lophiostoma macrostomum CBS 122681 TaxID=1314788 RepID=A0A6A6T8H3_9PLEO|nr:PGAM-domain-containing protein [Lophiostoma macrostomum CBS 122681]
MAPKQLHLVRHAHGYHNLCIENHQLLDPLLTPQGEQQCVTLSKEMKEAALSIDCIVASPSRRALYTALLTFGDVLNSQPNLRIIALPELQETAALPCDVGLPLEELLREFEGKPIDFSRLDQDWNNKLSGPFEPLVDLIQARAQKARKFLQSRPENDVAVVTHGALLHFITEDWAGCLAGCGTGWKNCELRTYNFDMSSKDAITNATILELPEPFRRRSHDLQPLSADEQLELREVAQRTWAAEGYLVIPAAILLGSHAGALPDAALNLDKVATTFTTSPIRHYDERSTAPAVKSLM